MGRLIICGNGFDLYHGLRTSWADYHKHLRDKGYTKLLGQIEHLQDANFWSDVESHLGLDLGAILDAGCRDSFAKSGTISACEVEKYVDDHTNQLGSFTTSLVKEWIHTINGELADRQRRLADPALGNADRFITFNYTNTLEQVYGINQKRILHVHGDTNEIQFGNPSEDTASQNVGKKLAFDYRKEDASKPAIKKLTSLAQVIHKDIPGNFQKVNDFLNQWEIGEVVVMGHNFSGVDLPYYKEIFFKRYAAARWEIYCYKQDDINKAKEFLKSELGKRDEECDCHPWPNPLWAKFIR